MFDVAVFEQNLLKTTAKTRVKQRSEGKNNAVEAFKSKFRKKSIQIKPNIHVAVEIDLLN